MANIELVHSRSGSVVRPRESEFEHIVWPYRLLIPFMTLIALYVHAKKTLASLLGIEVETNSAVVDGLSSNSRRVKNGSARWPALDACYNYEQPEGGNAFVRAIDDFWMKVRNAQAVRNRLKIVKRELRGAILQSARLSGTEPVRILSLAAGTAQGVIEAVAQLRLEGVRFQVVVVDRDESALRYATELARRHNLQDCVEIRVGDVAMFDRVTKGFQPHVVEMCGLMDYLHDTLAEKLVRKIRRHMMPQGYFLTCHVHPNSESYFLRQVVDWDMLYRPIAEFKNILIKGDFLNPRLETEPHAIHSVAICQKL